MYSNKLGQNQDADMSENRSWVIVVLTGLKSNTGGATDQDGRCVTEINSGSAQAKTAFVNKRN